MILVKATSLNMVRKDRDILFGNGPASAVTRIQAIAKEATDIFESRDSVGNDNFPDEEDTSGEYHKPAREIFILEPQSCFRKAKPRSQ